MQTKRMTSLRGERSTKFFLKADRSSNASWRYGNTALAEEESAVVVEPSDQEILAKMTSKNKQLNKKIDALTDQIDDLEFYKAECDRSLHSFKDTIKQLQRKNEEQRLIIETQQLRLDTFERLFEQMNMKNAVSDDEGFAEVDFKDMTSVSEVSDESGSQVSSNLDSSSSIMNPKPLHSKSQSGSMWKRLNIMRSGGRK